MYQELVEPVASRALVIAVQAELIEKLTVAELERRLGADSSNPSRPQRFQDPLHPARWIMAEARNRTLNYLPDSPDHFDHLAHAK